MIFLPKIIITVPGDVRKSVFIEDHISLLNLPSVCQFKNAVTQLENAGYVPGELRHELLRNCEGMKNEFL